MGTVFETAVITPYPRGPVMDFYEMLEQVLVLLQRHGRVSYRALKSKEPVNLTAPRWKVFLR